VEERSLWEAMKVILSRKGFDSSAGRKPSPIFPDGTMISLPIPDRSSTIAYKDIAGSGIASIGELVHDLAGIPQTYRAHLDPDVSAHSIPRHQGWRPLFGQVGAAEKHLENQGVGIGDVFLFFGLFRRVEKSGNYWTYVRGSNPVHVIFGWLQVAERVAVSNWPDGVAWALRHPHFRRESDPTNVLYIGAERLASPALKPLSLPGAGLFPNFIPELQLTEPGSSPSLWLLPAWFHPEGRASALTYHGNLSRWRTSTAGITLNSAARGQEFVLDCDDYPEATEWLRERLAMAKRIT
jgi:Nucleotide modification associated domain 3